ncbi:hypothetical protein B0T10DRAFT_487433 [Thelonectria olida]|uniref:Secreted protein n=1 Tax=Thelonectria olida TaxID=1576542 RepID=A0A9P9AP13_9HYPO|nr:hypothetical protein B0T10DRAFT_487433 [Thelonectria olida]
MDDCAMTTGTKSTCFPLLVTFALFRAANPQPGNHHEHRANSPDQTPHFLFQMPGISLIIRNFSSSDIGYASLCT